MRTLLLSIIGCNGTSALSVQITGLDLERPGGPRNGFAVVFVALDKISKRSLNGALPFLEVRICSPSAGLFQGCLCFS